MGSYKYVEIFQDIKISPHRSHDSIATAYFTLSQQCIDTTIWLGVDKHEKKYHKGGEVESIRDLSIQVTVYGNEKILRFSHADVIQAMVQCFDGILCLYTLSDVFNFFLIQTHTSKLFKHW